MTPRSWIWLIFTLIFLGLSIFHFVMSGKKVVQFQVTKRPLDASVTIKTAGSGLDQPLTDFAKDFNKYLDGYNKSTAWQNRFAAFGYLVAAAIAIFSMVLELKSKT